MIKEIKYFIFSLIIILFLFFSVKYYFSENNKKNSYRSLNKVDKRIITYAENLPILESDTQNIKEYVDQSSKKKKKKFNFWKLLDPNE
tara:strand:+ start:650 stop:913 length:264 start_codon:yes stop_codon:yes gene_type:complete